VLVIELLISSIAFLNPVKATRTTVTLSKLLQFKAFFMIHSAPSPKDSWMSGLSVDQIVFHTQSTQSLSFSLSKIPSHPKITKSWQSSSLKDFISGFATTTYNPCLAS